LTNGGFKVFNNENTEAIEFTKNKVNVTNMSMGSRYSSMGSYTNKDSKNTYMGSKHNNRLFPLLYLYGGRYKK
jgi:hypothetical protein